MPINEAHAKICCMMAKKFRLDKLLLLAMIQVESAGDEKAYRFEPEFWQKYLANNPEWMDRNPKEVSASYGLMQLMYTTAAMLGFTGDGALLYDPVINIELGAKLLRRNLDQLKDIKNKKLWPMDIAIARYNGGTWRNPDKAGDLRMQDYVDLVKAAYWKVRKEVRECD